MFRDENPDCYVHSSDDGFASRRRVIKVMNLSVIPRGRPLGEVAAAAELLAMRGSPGRGPGCCFCSTFTVTGLKVLRRGRWGRIYPS